LSVPLTCAEAVTKAQQNKSIIRLAKRCFIFIPPQKRSLTTVHHDSDT